MSKFRDLIENILKENSITLDEATVIRTNCYNNFNDGDKLIVIKNPSKEEYDNIKKNSKYNSIRGFVTEDDSVYVWDANLGIHQDVIDALDNENKKPYDVVLQFSQDENNNITIDNSFNSERLNNILDYKKLKYSNTNTLNAKDISNLNYYDFEILYNGIYKKENEIVQEFADAYSYEYDFDFSKLDYDNKPYNEKDDFKTFMKKAKQIIAKESNINLEEAKQVGLLYHATSINNLKNILKDNALAANRDIGISTSRTKTFFLHDHLYNYPFEACLVLDGDKLSNTFKILPFQYPNEKDSQETIIQTNKDLDDEKYGYPISSINKYNDWIRYIDSPEADEGCESDYVMNGSRLELLDRYLIEILIKKQFINNNNKESMEIINNICSKENIPIKYI